MESSVIQQDAAAGCSHTAQGSERVAKSLDAVCLRFGPALGDDCHQTHLEFETQRFLRCCSCWLQRWLSSSICWTSANAAFANSVSNL